MKDYKKFLKLRFETKTSEVVNFLYKLSCVEGKTLNKDMFTSHSKI